MSLARQNAQHLQQEFIGTEHVLLGIMDEGGGVAFKILKNHGVTKAGVEAIVKERIQPTTSPTVTLGQLPLSPRCKRVIELAGDFCDKMHHDVIGTEHLLFGLVKENEGIAADVLKKLIPNVDVESEIQEVYGVEIAKATVNKRDAVKDRDACLRELAYSHIYMKYMHPGWLDDGEPCKRQYKRLKNFMKEVAIQWHREDPDYWEHLFNDIRNEFENLC